MENVKNIMIMVKFNLMGNIQKGKKMENVKNMIQMGKLILMVNIQMERN